MAGALSCADGGGAAGSGASLEEDYFGCPKVAPAPASDEEARATCGNACEPVIGYLDADGAAAESVLVGCFNSSLETEDWFEGLPNATPFVCVLGAIDGVRYKVENEYLSPLVQSCWLPCEIEWDPGVTDTLETRGLRPEDCP